MSQLLALGCMIALALAAWQLCQLAWTLQQRRMAQARAQGHLSAFKRPALKDLAAALAEKVERALPQLWTQALGARMAKVSHSAAGPGELLLRCLASGLAAALCLAALMGGWGVPLGLVLGALPLLRLRDLEARRLRRLREELPDAMDLLTACVQAGLGLDQALARTGAQLQEGPLRQEWQRSLDAIRTGASRAQAFHDWEARSGVEELGLVLRAILRSEKRGVPLSPVLQAAAGQMRRLRSLRVQAQAGKAPVKMLLPLMLFFLPAVFLVLFGPVFLKLSALGF